MIISSDGINLNIGFAVMFTWKYENMKVKKVKNGYRVTITESDLWANKKHKIYFKTIEDVNEYANGIAIIKDGEFHFRTLEVPNGFISKKELKQKK
jgi:hypothetical protein